jgi:hypothetical protein
MAGRLVEHLLPLAENAVVTDLRLGLGYSAVQLDAKSVGVSWSPKSTGHACTVFTAAGTIVGRPAPELLRWLEDAEHPWNRVIGLATANAILNHHHVPMTESEDIITSLNLQSTDRVAMVGRFQPLLGPIKKSGCHLDIIELEAPGPDAMTSEEGKMALRQCSVAILTGTSFVTMTLDGLLEDLSRAAARPRAAILLGPSAPMFPEAFRGTPLTHIAGSWVRNGERVLQIVSEGGGTPQLKPFLVSANLSVECQS